MDSLSYLLPALFVLFIALQFLPVLRSKLMRGKPVPEIGDLLGDKTRVHQTLLIYFFSPGCGMCKSMTPVIEQLGQKRDNVLKVDIAQSAEALALARQFGIRGTPTTVLVRDGKIDRVLIGAKSRSQLEALLAC